MPHDVPKAYSQMHKSTVCLSWIELRELEKMSDFNSIKMDSTEQIRNELWKQHDDLPSVLYLMSYNMEPTTLPRFASKLDSRLKLHILSTLAKSFRPDIDYNEQE